MVVNGLTHIEPKSWEEIRKKVYLPRDVDEYKTPSRSLTVLSQNLFMKSCPQKDKALKIGYMVDVCRDGNVSPCALMLGLIYLQRLSVINPVYLTKVSSSDLFLTAMVVASKYLQDEGELEALVNSEWARVGQRSKLRLDLLEVEFLEAIDWHLFVSQQEYFTFATKIGAKISCTEAVTRGWWLYSDLISLWDASNTTTLTTTAKQVTKTMGTSLAVYLFTVTALLSTGSTTTSLTSSTSTAVDTVTPLLEQSTNNGWISTTTNTSSNISAPLLSFATDTNRHCVSLQENEMFKKFDEFKERNITNGTNITYYDQQPIYMNAKDKTENNDCIKHDKPPLYGGIDRGEPFDFGLSFSHKT